MAPELLCKGKGDEIYPSKSSRHSFKTFVTITFITYFRHIRSLHHVSSRRLNVVALRFSFPVLRGTRTGAAEQKAGESRGFMV